MLLLLSCWIIAGVTAEGPPTEHYRAENSSFCLNVTKSAPRDVRWTFNKKLIVYEKNVTTKHTDKVGFNPKDFSLCISKLTEADSGIYKGTIVDSDLEPSTEIHRLVVEKTVPRPVIRMSVMSSNISAGLCIFTVNCSVHADWLWSECDGDGCRTSQSSFTKVNITIAADNGSVVCSGSNHVSTSNVSKSTEASCFNDNNPREHEDTSQPSIVIVIIIAMCVSLCVFIVCVVQGLSTKHSHHQVQASIQSQPAEAQPKPAARVSTHSSSPSEASYENAEATQHCAPTISSRRQLGSKQIPEIDTVYSILEAANVTASSQAVTPDEAEHRTEIDTVYSVLQKPKDLKSQHLQ